MIRKQIRKILFFLGVLFILWVAWQFRPPPALPDLPPDYRAEKAVWLEITWGMDAHTEGEIEALAKSLQKHHITTVFAYVSYLKPNDTFNPTFTQARNLVQKMHESAPEIRLLAWIGVPAQTQSEDGEPISNRLQNASTGDLIV